MVRAVAREIADGLRARIEAGEWPDSRIPAERDLAETFGVARNTMRRAIALLQEDGAVTREFGRSAVVALKSTEGLREIVARMEGASPADVMEVRLMLEPSAAAVAATGASASELAGVEEAHREAMARHDMPEFEHWDAEFHRRIVNCSRNGLLREFNGVLHTLRDTTAWLEMKRRSFSEARRSAYCVQHAAILAGLLARDPEEARSAMASHLLDVRANLLGR